MAPVHTAMELPSLDAHDTPFRHPHCCLSLSTKLFDRLSSLFLQQIRQQGREQKVILSVGSGTGIFETLLQRHIDHLGSTNTANHVHDSHDADRSASRALVEGIEVAQSGQPVNRYLPEGRISTVPTTSTVAAARFTQDQDVLGLVFVYPRQKGLVAAYAELVKQEDVGVKVVVLLGPVSDWEEFGGCLGEVLGWSGRKMEGGDAGLAEGEVMGFWTRW